MEETLSERAKQLASELRELEKAIEKKARKLKTPEQRKEYRRERDCIAETATSLEISSEILLEMEGE